MSRMSESPSGITLRTTIGTGSVGIRVVSPALETASTTSGGNLEPTRLVNGQNIIPRVSWTCALSF